MNANENHAACDKVVHQIMTETLGLECLEERGSDRLDFSEHHVANIEEALRLAFLAGMRAARPVSMGTGLRKRLGAARIKAEAKYFPEEK